MVSPKKQSFHRLDNLNNILKELITLSNQDFSSLDDGLLAYIEFGIKKTGFSTGVVSHIENHFRSGHVLLNKKKSLT